MEKWGKAFVAHAQWSGPWARYVQKKEAQTILKWLKGLQVQKYNFLEVGCGNGLVGKILIEDFRRRGITYSYHFTDLLPECIDLTKQTLGDYVNDFRVQVGELDVYQADNELGKQSQHIIISTGYASAATYRESVPIISKILKEEGVLICDFVNHFSPFLLLKRPMYFFKYLFNRKEMNSYHFGRLGLKDFFKKHDLELIETKVLTWKRTPLLCMFRKRSK